MSSPLPQNSLSVVRHDGNDYSLNSNAAGEPLMLDLDVAAVARLSKPSDIRRSIRANLKVLGEVCAHARKVGPAGGKPGIEYRLTEKQAHLIIAKCRTSSALDVMTRLSDVYSAARKGNGPAAVALAQGAPRLSGGDSALDLLYAQSQTITGMIGQLREARADQAQIAARQASQELQMREIMDERAAVLAASANAEPDNLQPLPFDRAKLYVKKTVGAYMAFTGLDFQSAWRVAYGLLRDIGRFDVYARERNQTGPVSKRLSKLDIVSKEGQMDALASLVKTHMAEVMAKASTSRQLPERAYHA